MADIRIRKRKRMREKEIKALAEDLSGLFGIQTFTENDPLDIAEGPEFNLIFCGNEILGMIYEDKPFLTVRGLHRYAPKRRFVTVDMGAVKFVTNGADVMGPGIVEADDDISEGDLVWVRDERNLMPLAVGMALRDSAGIRAKEKGKAVMMLHYVGDKLWKAGE